MTQYGFDGIDIDLENGVNPTFMAQALRQLRTKAGANLVITLAPQTIDMQSTGSSYFALALAIKDILTVVNTQYYNSGAMLGCDQNQAYSQGTVNFIIALACIQMENGLRPDQVALGLPAGPGAAGGGVVAPSVVNNALDCLATATNCGTFQPPHTYPGIRGAMTWSINWDVTNGNGFATHRETALGIPPLTNPLRPHRRIPGAVSRNVRRAAPGPAGDPATFLDTAPASCATWTMLRRPRHPVAAMWTRWRSCPQGISRSGIVR